MRFFIAGAYPELQFDNQSEQLALAHLRADTDEIAKLRERITENLSLLPTNIPQIRPHLEAISRAFDEWGLQHPQLTATQLMLVRTLRKAVMQKAEITSLDALKKPPFSAIGDPQHLFQKPELSELLELVRDVAA